MKETHASKVLAERKGQMESRGVTVPTHIHVVARVKLRLSKQIKAPKRDTSCECVSP